MVASAKVTLLHNKDCPPLFFSPKKFMLAELIGLPEQEACSSLDASKVGSFICILCNTGVYRLDLAENRTRVQSGFSSLLGVGVITLHSYFFLFRLTFLPLTSPLPGDSPFPPHLSSSSEAAVGMSILLPRTMKGTVDRPSSDSKESSSRLDSGNRSRSAASTR